MGTSRIAQADVRSVATIVIGLRRIAIAALLLAGLICAQRSAADSLSGASSVTLTPLKETTGSIAARPGADIPLAVIKQRNGQGMAGEQVDWTVTGPGAATLSPDRATTEAQSATTDAGLANTVFHASAPGRYVVIATSQKNPGCTGDPCATFISTRFNLDVTDTAPAGGGSSSSGPSTTEVVAAVAIGAALAIAAASNNGGNNEQQPVVSPSVARTLTVVSGDGQSAAANKPLGQPLVVHAADNGANAASVAINWTASGGATLSLPRTLTDASGNATVHVLDVGPGPGPVIVTGTRSDNPGATVQFTITIVLPSLVIVSGDGQTGFTSAPVPNPLVVEALLGPSPQSNVPILWTITGGDASVTSVSNGGHTDGSGLSSAVIHFGPTPGPVSVTATRNDGSGLSQTFHLTSILIRTLSIVSGDHQSGPPNQPLPSPLVVHAVTNNNDASGVTINWSASGGATLSASSTITDGSGQSSVTVTNIGSSLGPVIVTATRADDPTATVQFTESIFAPTLTIVSGEGQSGLIGTAASATLDVELADGGGTPMVGQTVNWAVVSGSATLSSSTSTTDGSGYAPVSFTYGSTAGPIVFRATAFGGVASVDMHATAVTANSLTKISGDAQSGAPGTTLPVPLTVQIQPPAGVTVLSGVPINFTVISGSASVTVASVMTDASGQASTTVNLGLTPGPVSVLAQVSGGGPSATFTETVTGTLVAGVLTIVSGDAQVIAPNSASAPLVVLLKGNGNPLVGQTINWSTTAGTLSATSTVTDASGHASITVTPTASGPFVVTASFPGFAQFVATQISFSENTTLATIPTLTTNEVAVAVALDTACSTLQNTPNRTPQQQDLLNQCLALNSSSSVSTAAVANAIEQLPPKTAETQTATAHNATNAQFTNVAGRMSALRGGAHGASFGGLTFADPHGSLPFFDAGAAVLGVDDKPKQEVGSDFSRWGFFGSGTIGRQNGDPRAETPGYNLDVHGLTFGVDYRMNDHLVLGTALGYTRQNTNLDGGVGSLKMDGFSFSGYATWYQQNNWYLDSVLTYSNNNFDSRRAIVYTLPLPGGGATSVNQLAKASSSGDGVAGSLTFGRDFNSKQWAYGFYGKAQYSHQNFDAYQEQLNANIAGSGLGLRVSTRTETSSNTVLGGKLDYTASTSWGVMIPHAELEWQHDFHSDPSVFTAFFLDDPTNTPIVIKGDKLDANYFRLGLGMSFVLPKGRSGFILYNHSIGRSGISEDNLTLGFRMEF
jgi:outer membrane autotransporter protein